MAGTHQIPGVVLGAEIGRGARNIVYKGIHDGQPVAVKIKKDVDATTQEDVRRFRREATTLARAKHPNLPAILDTGEIDGHPYLVMEFVDGETLGAILKRLGTLPQARLVAFATELASTLHQVHRYGFIHRDLKPENILIDKSDHTKLVDFEFAAEGSSQQTVGSLLYASPEQAGMLDREVDARSDLYSLGVVLFECATGRPPFFSEDVGELVRQHARVAPPAVRDLNPAVTLGLAAIIDKLLCKDPDDRYQTSAGLLADLGRIDDIDRELSAGRKVPLDGESSRQILAATDVPLVGRHRELQALQSAWAQARRGNGQMSLIRGEPGAGKSRLTRELLQSADEDGVLILSCKCKQSDAFPFAPLREALDSQVRKARALPPAARQDAERELRAAIGDFAGLLKRFSPALGELLRDAPEASLTGAAQEQFLAAFSQIFLKLTGAAGAILFIDDVQWLDDSSREVIKIIAQQLERSRLLVIAAARNDEASAAATERFVEAAGAKLASDMTLGPLATEATQQLMSALLGGAPVDSSLVEQIQSRSNGNALAVGELVRAILDAGALTPSWGAWKLKAGVLDALDLPSDVVQLIIRRIGGLDATTAKILRGAAILGSEFIAAALPELCGIDGLNVDRALANAQGATLIERANASGKYVFVHDRIREAVLSPLTREEVRGMHQRAAVVLDRLPDPNGENVYALAQHYAKGDDPSTQKRLVETNWAAGERASRDFAYAEAVEFLERALNAALAARIPVTFELYEVLAAACVQMHMLTEATKYLNDALTQARTPVQRGRARSKLVDIHIANMELADAKREWLAALQDIGRPYPNSFAVRMVVATYDWICGLLRPNSRRREHADELALINLKLFEVGFYIAYFTTDPLLATQLGMRAYRLAQRYAVCPEVIAGYMIYGILWSAIGLFRLGERYARLSVDLATRLGDKVVLARALGQQGWVAHFSGHAVLGEQRLVKLLKEQSSWLDLREYPSVAGDLFNNLKSRGHFGRAAAVVDEFLKRVQQARTHLRETLEGHSHIAAAGGVFAAVRRPVDARKLLEKVRKNGEHTKARFTIQLYYGGLIHYLLEEGELGAPLDEAIEKVLGLGYNRVFLQPFIHNRHFAIMVAHARMAQLKGAMATPAQDPQVQRRHDAEVRRRRKQLDAAMNDLFWLGREPVFRAHLWALRAERMRLDGDLRQTERLLERCDAVAEVADNVWATIEGLRTRAHLERDRGRAHAAQRFAKLALQLSLEEGWSRLATTLMREFGVEAGDSTGAAASRTRAEHSTGPVDIMSAQAKQQLQTLVQVAVSSAALRDPVAQARRTLDSVIQMLGAERGLLFINNDDGSSLEIGRGSDGADLPELSSYSTTIVNRVRDTKKPIVLTAGAEGAVTASASIAAHGLRSIIAAPLMFGTRVLGVIYLDSRLAKGIFTESHVDLLVALGNQIGMAFETSRSARIEVEKAALEKDMALTGAMQQFFLPRQERFAHSSVRMVAFYQPAQSCGGDWWWVEPSDNNTNVLVGDITGHGAASAMMTAAIASRYETSAGDPISRLTSLSDMIRDRTQGRYFMTMSFVQLDAALGKLRWWSAGAPPILVRRAAGTTEVLTVPGSPLGSGAVNLGFKEEPLSPRDRLFVFTDGLVELQLGEGKQLGMRRLKQIFDKTCAMPLDEARAAIARELDSARGNTPLADDVTFALVERE